MDNGNEVVAPVSLFEQILHSFWHAPAAVRLMGRRSQIALVVYLLLAAGVMGGLGAWLIDHQHDLRRMLFEYLLPFDWQFAGEFVFDHFLATQTRAVLINAAVGGGLVLISMMLFPVKEWVSGSFEREARLCDEPPHEFPLWFQGYEELKLFLVYVTAQMSIFWLGYPPDPSRKMWATIASYAFLFASFSIDFISPVLQRHRHRYSVIVKTLGKHPVALFAFGAVFALPVVLTGRLVVGDSGVELGTAIGLVFGVNIAAIAWAVIAGTWMGARLLEPAARTAVSHPAVRVAAWLGLLTALTLNSVAFGTVARSAHHKSQVLKCIYTVDWGSFDFDAPDFRRALGGRLDVGVAFDVRIFNPTHFDVRLEDNRLEVTHGREKLASASLTPTRIPAGEAITQRVAFTAKLNAFALLEGRDLLEDEYAATLYFEVAPGMEFPVYLRAPGAPGTPGK